MKQAGRKSLAALAVVPTSLEAVERARPPMELTGEQAAIWNTVVGSRQAGFFTPEMFPVLVAYCKHTTEARRLDAALDGFDSEWLKEADGVARYAALAKLREMHTRAITSLATKMRLTQQSQVHKDAKGNRALTRRPWES